MLRTKSTSTIALFIFIVLNYAAAAVAQTKQAQQPAKEYTIEQFMNNTRIGGSSFASDEKSILFHSNKSGIYIA